MWHPASSIAVLIVTLSVGVCALDPCQVAAGEYAILTGSYACSQLTVNGTLELNATAAGTIQLCVNTTAIIRGTLRFTGGRAWLAASQRVTFEGSSRTYFEVLNITAYDIFVLSGATLNGSGSVPPSRSPFASPDCHGGNDGVDCGGNGGTHGGIGRQGAGSTTNPPVPFDANTLPLKSGGAAGRAHVCEYYGDRCHYTDGGYGGGYFYVRCNCVKFEPNTVLSVAGGNGRCGDLGGSGGGGGGGGILIDADDYNVLGTTSYFIARGGDALACSSFRGGAGGGGRIAVYGTRATDHPTYDISGGVGYQPVGGIGSYVENGGMLGLMSYAITCPAPGSFGASSTGGQTTAGTVGSATGVVSSDGSATTSTTTTSSSSSSPTAMSTVGDSGSGAGTVSTTGTTTSSVSATATAASSSTSTTASSTASTGTTNSPSSTAPTTATDSSPGTASATTSSSGGGGATTEAGADIASNNALPPTGTSSAIIGAAAALAFILLLVLLLIIVAWRRRNRSRASSGAARGAAGAGADGESTAHYSLKGSSNRAALVRAMLDAKTTTLIGSGMSAEVFRAKDKKEWVAIKRFKQAGGAVQDAEFHGEVAILGRLGSKSHPNVLQLHYIISELTLRAIVMDIADGGSLQTYVGDRAQLEMKTTRKISLFTQIASGMAFLHSNGVAHLDLKPPNVLFVSGDHAKIVDFGASTIVERDLPKPAGPFIGTPSYSAPERLSPGGSLRLFPTDVYSFGATVWAVMAREVPGRGADVTELVSLRSSAEPTAVFTCTWTGGDEIYALILSCCAPEPSKRPDFNAIVQQLTVTLNPLFASS